MEVANRTALIQEINYFSALSACTVPNMVRHAAIGADSGPGYGLYVYLLVAVVSESLPLSFALQRVRMLVPPTTRLSGTRKQGYQIRLEYSRTGGQGLSCPTLGDSLDIAHGLWLPRPCRRFVLDQLAATAHPGWATGVFCSVDEKPQ